MVNTIPATTASDHAWRRTLDETDTHQHLTTLEGWRQFTSATTNPPELLSNEQWQILDDTARADYDDIRLDYHTRLAAIATSALRKVVTTGRRLTLLNRHAVSARRGLILSGAAGTGKTTAITQFGKTHQAIDTARHPDVTDRIPVLYITVPPAATPRMVAAEFARFLAIPIITRANMTDIIEAVCGAEVSDMLKYFSERYLQLQSCLMR